MAAFSDTVLDHFLHPRGTGTLPEPTGEGWAGSVDQHRYMRMQVHVTDGVVQAATFATYGCAPAIAAGSWVCEWVAGRTVWDAATLTDVQVDQALEGLPEARRYCANLAVDALQAALLNAIKPAIEHVSNTPGGPP